MYKVYWTDPTGRACSVNFDNDEMTKALAWAKDMRAMGRTFVTMVSENPNVIGKPGVDGVVDGMLPDGEKYTWMKRRTQ